MKRAELLKKVEASNFKERVEQFAIGDTVDVHVKILEGAKERTQVFGGTVISRRGVGISETFTVRRIVNGEGVERTFPVHSPRVAKIESKRTGRVRRAKLYYLRDRVGKATKLRERKKGEALTASAEARAAKKAAEPIKKTKKEKEAKS